MTDEARKLQFGGSLYALVTPPKGPPRARLLCFHGGGGVGGNPEMLQPFCQALAAQGGIEIYAARYRTLNTDGAKLEEMRADAAAALDLARRDLAAGQALYVLGASFGGFLALDAVHAAPDGVDGLILLNAVTATGPDGFVNRVLGADRAALSPLSRWSGACTAGMRCFLGHGTADDVVPVGASRSFAAIWPKDRVTIAEISEAGHGFFNRPPHRDDMARRICDFIETRSDAAEPVTAAPPRKAFGLPRDVRVLYGIGAQKAGTTWLSDYLSEHPDVHMSALKEYHYFDTLHQGGRSTHITQRISQIRQLAQTLSDEMTPENDRHLRKIAWAAEYLRIFATSPGDHRPYIKRLLNGRQEERVVCDITPSYATLGREAFADMDGLGEARFVFLMREPVARMWSSIRMWVREQNGAMDDGAFERACIARATELHESGQMPKIPRADYVRTITELETAVPPERVLHVFHDDPMPQSAADSICDFLGIGRRDIPEALRSNVGREVPLPEEIEEMMTNAFRPQYDFACERFGDAVPETWHSRFAPVDPPQSAPPPPRRKPGLLSRLGLVRRGKVGDETTLVFLHIPKTAGQTIVSEIRRVVGRRAMSPVRTHSEVAPDAQMPQGYRVHAGHIDWVDLETLPDDRFAFSVLRDPRERIASFYFYLLREAEKLSPQELEKRGRTGMRRMIDVSPDEYFFGGDRVWQRFIRDHYDNFYANYFITRRIRGWKQIETMSDADRLEKAHEGTRALQRIYSVDDLGPLERDLEGILGQPLKLTGNYKNSGPDSGRKSRWADLIGRFEDKSLEARLDDFAKIDRQLMARLGLG